MIGSGVFDLVKKYGLNSNDNIGVTFGYTFGSKKNFSITPGDLPKFLYEYCGLVEENDDENSNLSLGEISDKNMPIMVNFTFKFDYIDEHSDNETIFYDDLFTANITKSIQDIMIEKLNLSSKMSELVCCVLESKHFTDETYTYIKMKFQFPYCKIDNNFYKNTIKPAIISNLRKNNVLKFMEYTPIGDWERILENNKNIIPLYGSKNSENEETMKLTHIYNNIDEGEIDDGDVEELELEDVFNVGNHSFIKLENIESDVFDEEDSKFWLPLFLTISYWASNCSPKEPDTQEKKSKRITNNFLIDDDDDKNPKYLSLIFLEMISPKRFEEENFWLMVGNALANIFDCDDSGLDIWIKYSPPKKYPKDKCFSKYYSFRSEYLSVKILGWFARIDSQNEYNEWHNEWCQNALKDALTLVPGDTMEAVYRLFWLDYTTTGDGKNSWYRYKNNHYNRLKNIIALRKDIHDKLIPIYRKMITVATAKSEESHLKKERAGDRFNAKTNDIFVNQINALIKKLGTPTYINSVLSMSEIRFLDENFEILKDTNHLTIGCSNGVIECCGSKAYFREGNPEDYITMNTRIPYRKDFNWKSQPVVDLMEWLVKVFCGDLKKYVKFSEINKDNKKSFELLHHFLKDSSAFLMGKNAEKIFRVWIGGTNASKSVITKLFQMTFGQYFVDLPLSLITKTFKGSGSGPSPETAQLKGAHGGVYTEPDADDELVAGKIKKRSGGDRDFSRMCNENGGSVEALAKEILVTNVMPDIKNMDEATKNRFGFMLFLSKFVDNAPEDVDEQYRIRRFPNDPFFESKLPSLAEAFLWVLVEYFPIYKKEGLKPPKIIVNYANEHWEKVDIFTNFVEQELDQVYIEDTKNDFELNDNGEIISDDRKIDEDSFLTNIDMYPRFVKWFRDNNPGKDRDIPNSERFKDAMLDENRLGKANKRGQWFGISFYKKKKRND